jgi:hypothetical protein
MSDVLSSSPSIAKKKKKDPLQDALHSFLKSKCHDNHDILRDTQFPPPTASLLGVTPVLNPSELLFSVDHLHSSKLLISCFISQHCPLGPF